MLFPVIGRRGGGGGFFLEGLLCVFFFARDVWAFGVSDEGDDAGDDGGDGDLSRDGL